MPLNTTTEMLVNAVAQRSGSGNLSLFLKEYGTERLLAATEKPGQIMRERMHQAGYMDEDERTLLAGQDLNFLLRFACRPDSPKTVENFNTDKIDTVNLRSRNLREIPDALYRNAAHIRSLDFSHNPMLDIPIHFSELCSQVQELRLSQMAFTSVPIAVQHFRTLEVVDLSSNRLADLDGANLHTLSALMSLSLRNNQFERLPDDFGRFAALEVLDLSSNSFNEVPHVVTQLAALRCLDVSFNSISQLPAAFGYVQNLETLFFAGNHVSHLPDDIIQLSKLRTLDCRWNSIRDLRQLSALPNLESLMAEHNPVSAHGLVISQSLVDICIGHSDLAALSVETQTTCALTSLDISHTKLASLDDPFILALPMLTVLNVSYNDMSALPGSIGNLSQLQHLDCSNNHIQHLPSEIGMLDELELLDVHNNSLFEVPATLWNCSKLRVVNMSANRLEKWLDVTSPSPSSSSAPLSRSLERLYLGHNALGSVVHDEECLPSLLLFPHLRILDLSYNGLEAVPSNLLQQLTELEELRLNGNKLTHLSTLDDLPRSHPLSKLFLNGNRLQSISADLGTLELLEVVDVSWNKLKYNMYHTDLDWNWNMNKNLKYLNLLGNYRLKIQPPPQDLQCSDFVGPSFDRPDMEGFSSLPHLRVLGLTDVAISTHGVTVPDETHDLRVRTSGSSINGMAYGIADSLGSNLQLDTMDLAHELRRHPGQAAVAIFARTLPSVASSLNSLLIRYLRDHFVKVLETFLGSTKDMAAVLRKTFLRLNQEAYSHLYSSLEGPSTSSTDSPGASGVALYFDGPRLCVANVGNSHAVISHDDTAELLTRHHSPTDSQEIARIRACQCSAAPQGLPVSRSFGLYHLFPVINARPDTHSRVLTEVDEFIIVASRGLWDYVSYQSAVDVVRTTFRSYDGHGSGGIRPAQIAAYTLRDFAMSCGAEGRLMVVVIHTADLFPKPVPPLPLPIKIRRPRLAGRSIQCGLPKGPDPPAGYVALVTTDLYNSTSLWESNPGMPAALKLHNTVLRRYLRLCGGYEVWTEGDSFLCAFPDISSALHWCLSCQRQLLEQDWPEEILDCEDGREVLNSEGRIIMRGLAVRMGLHFGESLCERTETTKRMDYFGETLQRALFFKSQAGPGQIVCSTAIMDQVQMSLQIFPTTPPSLEPFTRDISDFEVFELGEVRRFETMEVLSVVYPAPLKARHFPKEHRLGVSFDHLHALHALCRRLEALAGGWLLRERDEDFPFEVKEGTGWPGVYHGHAASQISTTSARDLSQILDQCYVRISDSVPRIKSRIL
ncbi:hypothetical protein DL96DRAFT_1532126 [Flagelloscypha sp. PMI_526]|nr:hypothetical protein DL96DRAFT_1532126 [Flagelloscypha sp. PMI_526]